MKRHGISKTPRAERQKGRKRKSKGGMGKRKGSKFERVVCKKLSLWVTNGKMTDVFWRSAISGGRATVQHRKGVTVRQAGDIVSVAPEGHVLTDHWFIECKHVRSLDVTSFLLKNVGHLAKFWKVAQTEAAKHKRAPMIIAKENNSPVVIITRVNAVEHWTSAQLTSHARDCDISFFEDILLYDGWRYRRGTEHNFR